MLLRNKLITTNTILNGKINYKHKFGYAQKYATNKSLKIKKYTYAWRSPTIYCRQRKELPRKTIVLVALLKSSWSPT